MEQVEQVIVKKLISIIQQVVQQEHLLQLDQLIMTFHLHLYFTQRHQEIQEIIQYQKE